MRSLRPFVLSGGGARGFAHLGILKAFEKNNIFPEAIAATSSGSIVAACICDGYSSDETKDLFLSYNITLSMQWRGWRSGLLSLKKVEQFLQKTLRHKNFEELTIPLFVTATNFITGDQFVFDKGEIIPAIMAASSIPVLFHPVEINGIPYVDGRLSGNLPLEPLLNKYKRIIGVHVNPLSPYNIKNGFVTNLERVLHLAMRDGILKNKKHCDLFVEPEGLRKFGLFDFKHFEAIYNAGLEYTRYFLELKLHSQISQT